MRFPKIIAWLKRRETPHEWGPLEFLTNYAGCPVGHRCTAHATCRAVMNVRTATSEDRRSIGKPYKPRVIYVQDSSR